jgi:hypothetical protein
MSVGEDLHVLSVCGAASLDRVDSKVHFARSPTVTDFRGDEGAAIQRIVLEATGIATTVTVASRPGLATDRLRSRRCLPFQLIRRVTVSSYS